ncbi:PQQ-binding-like beta-propeller repeat protein [Haliangium sp.]|uniref:outer membrane protein assembly factor BamB family protein n=1 Tax=Haliangium sp. TaxID=2663208 RepID=UPI003D13D6AA
MTITTGRITSAAVVPRGAMTAAVVAVTAVLMSAGCRTIPARHDPFSTAQPGEAGLPVLTYRWHLPLSDRLEESNPQEFASVAQFGDRLYAGSARGDLYSLATTDGHVRWRAALGGINAAPILDERGRLYVGTVDGDLVCLDAENGTELWRYDSGGSILRPPVVADGQVVFSNEADQVYALDADTGKFRWQYKSDTPEEYTLRGHSGVVLDGDLVFTGFANGNLVALRQSTGSVAWLTSLKGDADRFVDVDGTPVVAGDSVYVTASAGGVYAVDKTTGLMRWRLPVDGASGVAVDGNRIYATAADSGVYAIDPEGNLVWRQGTRGGGEPATPLITGTYLIYSLAEDGMFVADKRTGQVHQFFDPGDGISAVPLVTADELYVVSNRGILYAMYVNRL